MYTIKRMRVRTDICGAPWNTEGVRQNEVWLFRESFMIAKEGGS